MDKSKLYRKIFEKNCLSAVKIRDLESDLDLSKRQSRSDKEYPLQIDHPGQKNVGSNGNKN
jgi:hypothetical protein